MNIQFLLWSIPFFLVSLFHLYCCFVDNKKPADISKALLMPMLLFALWGFTALSKGQSVLTQTTVLLSLGIVFGGMGDVYLLKQKEGPSFFRGIAAFLIGHIFYIVIIFSDFTFLPLPIVFIIVASIVYASLILLAWVSNKRPKPPMAIALIVYATVLSVFNGTALFLLVGHGLQTGFSSIPASIVQIFIGSLLFLVSDSILAHTIFVKTFRFHRFIVMLTYLAAQFFITFGISTLSI